MSADNPLPDALQKKAGPFPVWVWGAAIGLVIVAYVWWSGRDNGSGDATTSDNDGETSNLIGNETPFDAIDGLFRNNSGGESSNNYNPTEQPQVTDSNTAWGIRAVAALVGKGTAPITAQQAISKYLSSEQMTKAQEKLVNQAISLVGQPPEPVDVPDVLADPVPEKPKPQEDKLSHWSRLSNGDIMKHFASGSKVKATTAEYIDAGMPAFRSNAYEYQTYKIPSNATTAATVAKKYSTSVDNIRILNNWKSIPNLKKGQSVKVPAVKGTGK